MPISNKRVVYTFETMEGAVCLAFRREPEETAPTLSESRAGRDESCLKSVNNAKESYPISLR